MTTFSSRKQSKSGAIDKEEIDNKSFLEYCESIYLSVFENVEEEISSSDELILLLQHSGYNPSKKTIGKYWNKDTDSYNFKQFCEILKQEENISKKDLLKAFKKIDCNGDSFITHDELLQVLTKRGERMTKAEVKMMIDDADFNGDGKLDYEEFCDMVESTSNMCQQLHVGPKKDPAREMPKALPRPDKKHRDGQKISTTASIEKQFTSNSLKKSSTGSSLRKVDEEKEKHIAHPEEKTSKKSLTLKSGTGSNKKDEHTTFSVKLKEEPKDLSRWNFQSMKGCFYKEEDGKVESHHFQMKVTQPTSVWMTIKPSPPKYGKFQDDVLENDMTLFLVELSSSKLVAFSNSTIDGKSCLLAELDIGVYKVFTFSSGAKLLQEESESGQVSLVKGTGDEMRLSKSCKDAFMEIFYRCDLDGNGYLSRNEFNGFQLKTSGEDCDDEAWDVVKENFEVTPQAELTPNGFINLNLMEARDPQGGPDELWVTLESMGYSKKLLLNMACPFLLEVYTKRIKLDMRTIGVSDGDEGLKQAMNDAVKAISSSKPFKNRRDVLLHTAQFDRRVTLAVENQTNGTVRVRLDCSASENVTSHQNTMVVTESVERKSVEVFHHMIPENKSQRMQIVCNESIEK